MQVSSPGSVDPPAPAPDQRAARIAGVLFILTFVTSIPAALLYGPLLNHPGYVNGGGADTQIAVGAFLEILLMISGIGTAVVLFPVLKRYGEAVALGYVATRTIESAMIAVGIVSVLSVVTLRQDLAGGGNVGTLVVTGRSLVAIHDWTFLLGPSFCAGIGNGILLGSLLYRSRLVPRRMAMIGLVGGPLAVLAAAGVLFDVYEQDSAVQGLLTIPEIVWEASLGIYLAFKGFTTPGRVSGGTAGTEGEAPPSESGRAVGQRRVVAVPGREVGYLIFEELWTSP